MPDGPKVIDTYLFHFLPQKWKDALHARASFLLRFVMKFGNRGEVIAKAAKSGLLQSRRDV